MTTQTELLRNALERIAEWDECDARFRMDHGSNGERDYYRQIARTALAQPEQPVPQGLRLVGLFSFDADEEDPSLCFFQGTDFDGKDRHPKELCRLLEEETTCGPQKALYAYASPTPPQAEQAEAVEMSPEFTDTARAALLWVLWHHQGSACKVGQPLRFALGMGQHERMNEHQVREAKRWGELAAIETAKPPKVTWPITEEEKQFHEQHSGAAKPDIRPRAADAQPLTDEQKRDMWKRSDFRGSGGQYEWYLQGIEEAERAHGITGKDNAS